MKTTKEMIEVMEAFDKGKRIECRGGKREEYSDLWELNDEPSWNWRDFDYRIKPERKTRPMTFDEIVAYWKEHRTEIFTIHHEDIEEENEESMIYAVDWEKEEIKIGRQSFPLQCMLGFVTKEDGTKFEVEEE